VAGTKPLLNLFSSPLRQVIDALLAPLGAFHNESIRVDSADAQDCAPFLDLFVAPNAFSA
jgi:hypothetical protein